MSGRLENVLPHVRADKLDAAARGFPDPSQAKEEIMEGDTTDETGRRVRVRYYKFTLRVHRNTWHMWCPEYACYIDG